MDIFDEIIACIRNEGDSSNGKVYVSRDNLVSFLGSSGVSRAVRTSPRAVPAPERIFPAPLRTETPPHENFPVPQTEKPAGGLIPAPDVSSMGFPELKRAVESCRACGLCERRRNTVFSDGDEHAQLMFIGEGPGEDEDIQGVPFVGRAGQLLTKMISAMRFDRSEVYIANIVKCRPPGNRNPEEGEAACCMPYLKRQIELVNPKVIVLLGAVPLKYLMKQTGITRMRGHWLEYGSIPVMPTLHPAYLLRNPAAKAGAWSDLQQVMKFFGKVPAGHGGREASHGS